MFAVDRAETNFSNGEIMACNLRAKAKNKIYKLQDYLIVGKCHDSVFQNFLLSNYFMLT